MIELFNIGMPVVRTDGRAYGHVITKFSRIGRLPHFLNHGALQRALRARELRYDRLLIMRASSHQRHNDFNRSHKGCFCRSGNAEKHNHRDFYDQHHDNHNKMISHFMIMLMS